MEESSRHAAEVLRETPLFAALPDGALEQLAASAVAVRLPAGGWLFRQGEAGSALYVVLSGRLEAVLEEPPPERALRLLGRGEVIGEVAFVTGATRSASVRARRDSELLEISYESVRALLRDHADVAVELLQVLARRLATGTGLAAPATGMPRTLTVLDLRDRHDDLLADLVAALGHWGRVALLRREMLPDATEPGRLVDELEQKHDTVVLAASAGDPVGWREFCVRQGDRLVCVADAGSRAPTAGPPGGDLALAGSSTARVGGLLDAFRPRAHHWLDLPDRAAGVARMVRRLIGRSTGIVLSGGGARGFAHLGVLDRLHDRGIVLDRVGGCSMGSFVAALAAAGHTPAESITICREELARRNPFNDYTVPRQSLIRAQKAASMLHRVFGDAAIEACATDFFCVSADLVNADLVVHRSGLIRDAVGASMSIPGFAPPREDGGRLLVDGGVLDNLPVGVMAATGEGPVFAVDVMGRTRLGRPGTRPTLVETLARATVLGSWQRLAQTREQAAVVLTPELGPVGLLDFRRIDEAVEAGRGAVDEAVEAGLL